MKYDNINYKNPTSNNLLEIKFYSTQIEKYLKLFFNSINNEDKLKTDFCNLFENINNINVDKLFYFFKSKILRIINQNASVAGIEPSSYNLLSFFVIFRPIYFHLSLMIFLMILNHI